SAGIKGLLDFAVTQLGLPSGLFRTYEEQDGEKNNFFDADGVDLGNLLDLLPDDDGSHKKTRLEVGYQAEDVVALFGGKAEPLVFAKGGALTAAGPTYPLRISFENVHDAVPTSETHAIRVSFVPTDLPPTTVTLDWSKKYMDVMIPAAAQQIVLESDGFYL